MIRSKVNAMGDPCPIPVVKTKNAIRELQGQAGSVEVLVDNEIAVQNLTKMAGQKGYGVHAKKLEAQKFQVTLEISGENETSPFLPREEEASACIPDTRAKNTVLVISSPSMGEGDPKLGAILMKSYFYALTQQDTFPETILCYNGGVRFTCEESPTLEDLKFLEAQGAEILSCGTCLDFYGLTEKLKVGGITNMYVIAEKMQQAKLLIKP